MVMRKRALLALLLVVGLLSLATLACTSDQEWIIPRTATPTPTNTPLPMTGQADFQVGDRARVTGQGVQVFQTRLPEPDLINNRVLFAPPCFVGSTVEILEVAQGEDGEIYYKVNCGQEGWVPQTNLAPAS